MHHALYVKCRDQAERESSPTAAIIDAQSVKSAEKGGKSIDPHGYDAGKKIKGKKRHVLVDTQGFVLHAIVTAADIQDRDGGAMLLATLFGMFPFLLKLYADGGYQGPQFQKSLKLSCPRPRCRSSSDPIATRASSSCRGGGWSNARSPGSTGAADWPRIGRTLISRHAPSCSLHPSV